MKKIFFFLAVLLTGLASQAANAWQPDQTITLKVGEYYLLSTDDVIRTGDIWRSSGDEVVLSAFEDFNSFSLVYSGFSKYKAKCKVYAVKPGVCYVTYHYVTNINNLTATQTHKIYKFIIEPIEPTEMILQHQLSMEIGSTANLAPSFYPSGTSAGVTWLTSNANVVSVSGGTLTAKSVGEATITCISAGGLRQDCDVTVLPKKAQAVSMNTIHVNMKPGDSYQLITEITPDEGTQKQVVWRSLNPSVVSVDENGLVQCLADGWALVTATTTDGTYLTAGCVVQVGNAFGGDVNSDDKVDIDDVNMVISIILGKA